MLTLQRCNEPDNTTTHGLVLQEDTESAPANRLYKIEQQTTDNGGLSVTTQAPIDSGGRRTLNVCDTSDRHGDMIVQIQEPREAGLLIKLQERSPNKIVTIKMESGETDATFQVDYRDPDSSDIVLIDMTEVDDVRRLAIRFTDINGEGTTDVTLREDIATGMIYAEADNGTGFKINMKLGEQTGRNRYHNLKTTVFIVEEKLGSNMELKADLYEKPINILMVQTGAQERNGMMAVRAYADGGANKLNAQMQGKKSTGIMSVQIAQTANERRIMIQVQERLLRLVEEKYKMTRGEDDED